MRDTQTHKQCISSELRFYTVSELQELLGWSERTVLKLFNDPSFPAADFGRTKVVEAHAAIEYLAIERIQQNGKKEKTGEGSEW